MIGAYLRLNAKMLASSAASIPSSAFMASAFSGLEPHATATLTMLWAYAAWYAAFVAFSCMEKRRGSGGLRAYFAGMGAPLLAGEAVYAAVLWYFYYLLLLWEWDAPTAYLLVNAAAYAAFVASVNAAARLDLAGRFKSHRSAGAA